MGVACKDVIGERLDAHIANFFDTYEAAEAWSTLRLTSTSFLAPIANLVWRKTFTALEDKTYTIAVESEGLVNIIPTYDDDSESLASWCSSR